jgi:hypothetical protein
MTGSLAWPVSAAIIALIFRGQIKAVFSRLDELGYGDWKIKLNKDLEQAEVVASELPPPPQPPVQQPQQIEGPKDNNADRFEKLVSVAPNAAILDAWFNIEMQMREIATSLGTGALQHLTPSELIKVMGTDSLFPSSLVRLLREMLYIRNLASHSSRVTVEDAYRFRELADRVKPFLEVRQYAARLAQS